MKMSMLGTGTELAFTAFLIWNKCNQIKLSGWFKFVQIFQLRTEYLLQFFFFFLLNHIGNQKLYLFILHLHMQICLSNSITLLTSSNHFFIHNKYIDGENIQRIWNSTIASYSLFKVFMRSLSSGVWMDRKNFDTWIKVEKLDLIEISIWNLYFFMVITISHHIIPYEIGYTLNEYIMILKKRMYIF